MIMLCGDTHGNYDIKKIAEIRKIPDVTYLIVLGDMGCVWYPKESPYYRDDVMLQDYYKDLPFKTLFIDGNHENFEMLNAYPVEEWNGGKIHKINDNLYHLMRGQVFTIEGNTIFTMGGASSHDRNHRTAYIDWWPDELPTYSDVTKALFKLAEHDNKVDYILTHCAPQRFVEDLVGAGHVESDILTELFDGLYDTIDFKHWYHGHYHISENYEDNITCLYNGFVKLGDKQ